MNKTMNNKLNKKELKRKVITVLDTVIFAILLVFSSCSNNTQQDITPSETPDVITQESEQNQEKGIATVRMFIPDYYALAEQNAERAIAPQTKTVRLSYRLNDSWIGINTIDLSSAVKTPVENVPEGFTGSVYTCTFDGVPVGTYNIDNLKIELMDISGNTITSGTNTTSVTITKGASASTTFYTIPVSTEPNVGNLAAGEMKFSLEYLYTDIKYKVSMKTSGDYPDIVLFSNDGRLMNYYAIDSAEDETQIEVPVSGQYYIGVWADDGNKIGRYEYSFGKMKFETKELYKGIHYDIDISSNGAYPDVVLFKEGELVHYYTISGENESHITLIPEESGQYTFVIYGNENDNYSFEIDDLKIITSNLMDKIDYNIVISSINDYPNLVLLKISGYGAMGELIDSELINYWIIKDEQDCKKTISVDERGLYAFALIGKKLDSYNLQFDLSEGTEIYGTIPDSKLHWTKENSPYVITNNLWIPEDKVLYIDAGVVVQFTGNYYIKMNGVIKAIGTAEKPIIFVNSANSCNWNGIKVESSTGGLSLQSGYNYVDGSIFKYCKFVGAQRPLELHSSVYVDNCVFTGNNEDVYLESSNSFLINNIFDNGLCIYNDYSTVINNKIRSSFSIATNYALIKNNNIENSTIYFGWGNYFFTGNNVKSCSISNISDMSESAKISGNNFLGYRYPATIIDVSSSYSDRKSYNFTSNYWGEQQTVELEEKGDKANISFFNDIYDDFNHTEIKYSGWMTEPYENCGYSETGFVAFDFTVNGYDFNSGEGYFPESKNTTLQLRVNPQYFDSEISRMRVAQSYEELKAADWIPYNKTISYTVDKDKFLNDTAMVYMQVKDSAGNESACMVHSVPFDTPKVDLSVKDGTVFDNSIKKQSVSFSTTDLCNIVEYSLSIDGTKVSSGNNSWGTELTGSYQLGLLYMASGSHSITISAKDSAGNKGEKTVSFTISRNFDSSSIENISYDTTSGQLLKDADTIYLWHLDNDGEEIGKTVTIDSYYHTNGGFGGAASSLEGNVPIDIKSNAFTVEFWTRGNGSVQLNKDSVFDCRNYWGSVTSYENHMYHYYKTTDTVSASYVYANSSVRNRADDQWHYWAYVYSGTYQAIFCDGICVSYSDGFTHSLNSNNNNLSVSSDTIIDELRISSNARSADEISSYYKIAKPILDSNTVSVNVIVW